MKRHQVPTRSHTAENENAISHWAAAESLHEISVKTPTLRDYFAAEALIVAARDVDGEPEGAYIETVQGIASRAYLLADAMLKARE